MFKMSTTKPSTNTSYTYYASVLVIGQMLHQSAKSKPGHNEYLFT